MGISQEIRPRPAVLRNSRSEPPKSSALRELGEAWRCEAWLGSARQGKVI